MQNTQIKKKGVRVNKEQTAYDALMDSMPHWIHHKVEAEGYIGGYKYLPQCDCSECGFTSNVEQGFVRIAGQR